MVHTEVHDIIEPGDAVGDIGIRGFEAIAQLCAPAGRDVHLRHYVRYAIQYMYTLGGVQVGSVQVVVCRSARPPSGMWERMRLHRE